jgi:hypothetical protein
MVSDQLSRGVIGHGIDLVVPQNVRSVASAVARRRLMKPVHEASREVLASENPLAAATSIIV